MAVIGPGRQLRAGVVFLVLLEVCSWSNARAQQSSVPAVIETKADLGGALFADRNLSFSRRQNCVSCHSPELAFTDPRQLGAVQGAVSRGNDGRALGDRNAPTLGYASLTPPFHFNSAGQPVGGMFHDGRAVDLPVQAGAPLINPVEMGMPDRASVVARLRENPSYLAAFTRLFGASALDEEDKAFAAFGEALAAFESSQTFAPFDSKYDRALRGEAVLSDEEEAGRALFFDSQRSSCSRCHAASSGAKPSGDKVSERFSNAGYFNLGVPENTNVRGLNGKAGTVDHGLMQNPAAATQSSAGKFKVPTLRNVAITGPYMHNGVFQELRTAILFHGRFNGSAPQEARNPETSQPWAEPEVAANVEAALLTAPPLGEAEIKALIAFLSTLTDQRYEHLVPAP